LGYLLHVYDAIQHIDHVEYYWIFFPEFNMDTRIQFADLRLLLNRMHPPNPCKAQKMANSIHFYTRPIVAIQLVATIDIHHQDSHCGHQFLVLDSCLHMHTTTSQDF